LLACQQLQAVDFVAFEEVRRVGRAFQPADHDLPLRQAEIVPAQIAGFTDAKAMAEDHKTDEPVTVAMPVALQGGQQLVHFLLGQVLAGAVGLVRLSSTGRFTNTTRGRRNGVLRDHLCVPGW
jgi:hypothetical protein